MAEQKMVKIAAENAKKFHSILKTAADCIERVTAERDALMEELQKMATDREVLVLKEKLAAKGINPWGTTEAMEAALQKKAANPRALEVFKEAVDSVYPNMKLASFGELADGPDSPVGSSENSKAQLDSFVMNGE